MCRDILNTCVRNTEEAEKHAKAIRGTAAAGKAVWGMIEESALAKTFKKGEGRKVDDDLLSQAKACLAQLEALHTQLLAPASAPSEDQPSSETTAQAQNERRNEEQEANELTERAKAALLVIEDAIQATDDPIRIEELFHVNDCITGVLARIEDVRTASPPGTVPAASGIEAGADGGSGTVTPRPSQPKTQLQQRGETKLNGLRLVIPASASLSAIPTQSLAGALLTTEPEALETPRVDKGKRRAAPEPEVHEPVTSPNVVLRGSDEEDDTETFDPEEGDREGLEGLEGGEGGEEIEGISSNGL